MEVFNTPISGLKVIELKKHVDERGFFIERFNKEKFQEFSLPTEFVQDNHSQSAPNILRGLHFQHTPPQGKLVGCISGAIFDVAVDIREKSPTFGKYFSVELSAENCKLLWIPDGFAHGFCVIGDKPADVLYKVTNKYNPNGEIGIHYADSEIGINWPIKDPIVSKRDVNLLSFSEYRKNPVA